MEHQKLYRIFNLISRLRSPLGINKHSIAEDYGLSVRSIERYLRLLEDIGFPIQKRKDRLFIPDGIASGLKHEMGLAFSLEEAAYLRDCLLNSGGSHQLKEELMQKLFALSDLREISKDLGRLNSAKKISSIRKAIQNKKQVVLEHYQSANSESCNHRKVEPIQFIHYYRYLVAFETETQKVKHFKTDRIEGVRVLQRKWQHESLHKLNQTDLFGMSGKKKFKLDLILSKRAAHLLKEEYPAAEKFLSKQKPNGYRFQHWIASVEGAGRFVLSLIDEIEIQQPTELQEYVQEKIKKFSCDTDCRKRGGNLGVK